MLGEDKNHPSRAKGLKRIELYLDAEHKQLLRSTARQQGYTMAGYIKRLLSREIPRPIATTTNP